MPDPAPPPGRGLWIPPQHRARLSAVTRRTRIVLGLAALTGVATGLVVAGFEVLTADVLLHGVRGLPLAGRLVAPAIGLALAAVILRATGRRSPATADEYIVSFHGDEPLDLRPVPGRIAAAVATLGSGAPLGYEGPALYAGAAIGTAIQRRWSRYFAPEDAKVLLVAGAAAGVAAIFKAPVTGLVFALEVPYQDDLAHRMLLPAAISAAASYAVFATIAGTEPILPVAGRPPFDLLDLGGAVLIGIAAGVFARIFALVIARAKALSGRGPVAARVAIAGTVLAATVALTQAVAGSGPSLGPGYQALRWALDPRTSIAAIVALATLRVLGTAATIGGGGVGGLFVPLVIQGALVGRAVGGLFEGHTTSLFPVVGIAAFLGAGYRVPLASVVFVAEFTGRPGFVVPGLIAAVVAQLAMGSSSVSAYQRAG